MNLPSPTYGIFLLLCVGIYWFGGRFSPGIQLWVVFIFSLLFYGFLQPQYLPLLLIITVINFCLGKAMATNPVLGERPMNWNIEQEEEVWNPQGRKLLILGIVLNVLVLLSFKYIPFLLNTAAVLFNLTIALESANWISDRLIAPLGISFFTFESIAYLIDVYRGAPPTPQFLQFASYKLFFPKLISGPITRYHNFTAQIKVQQIPSFDQLTEGLWLIAAGAVKKALIADQIGIFVSLVFSNLERAGSGDLWLATFAYGLQLYFDFSGYVDIARGSALLLGFNLPQNFNFPYFATSIADFWRRWHITLGDWLRNYLYFPLGGNRRGLFRTNFNLMIIMLIAGIWHGAAWGYVLWGGWHGLALIVHRLTESLSKRFSSLRVWWESLPGIVVAWFITQCTVFGSWILFRLPNVAQANLVFQHFWNYSGDIQFASKIYIGSLGIPRPYFTILLGSLFLLSSLAYFVQKGLKLQLNWSIKLILVPLCFYGVWLLAPEGGLPYIYFDF